MDAQTKRKIIINEISYWKQSRLLPEAYCNFLLTLYSEGNQELVPGKTQKLTRLLSVFSYIYIALVLPLAFLVIYFTEKNFVLQIPIFIFLIIVAIGISVFMKNDRYLHHFSAIIGALLFLLLSVKVTELFFSEPFFIFVTVVIHCFFWLFVGLKTSRKYFSAAGVIGFLITIIAFFK